MIELLMIAEMTRNPLQAMARRWYRVSLFKAMQGRCADCTAS
jgi:hypothetical protein